MIIKSLEIINFRNHEKSKVSLGNKINVLVGKNAQGKTNLLEAIYLTCVGRGWRTHKEREMIMFDKDRSIVRAQVEKKFGDITIEVSLSRKDKKAIKINDIPVQKMGELMGQINCVFFSPDELRLVKDAPADRRRFLDIDISQIDKAYFYSLLKYNKILMQRNALLKSKTANGKAQDIERGLDVWDMQLVRVGAFIIYKRLSYIEQLKPFVTKVHNYLTSGQEQIELSYINITSNALESPLGPQPQGGVLVEGSALTVDEVEEILAINLRTARDKDMRLKTTTVGPHRDDLLIKINGKDVRYFASQGQQRTTALSLKLGELELFEQATGEKPILLLDDVFSELDDERQSRLIKILNYCQSIITATSDIGVTASNTSGHKTFEVKNGKVVLKKM